MGDPRIRSLFRNIAFGFFFLLFLLFLFKDPIQPTGLNRTLGLVDHDYPDRPVTVLVPVNACLRTMLRSNQLLITLHNYDNNRYSQLFTLATQDNTPLSPGLSWHLKDLHLIDAPPDIRPQALSRLLLAVNQLIHGPAKTAQNLNNSTNLHTPNPTPLRSRRYHQSDPQTPEGIQRQIQYRQKWVIFTVSDSPHIRIFSYEHLYLLSTKGRTYRRRQDLY